MTQTTEGHVYITKERALNPFSKIIAHMEAKFALGEGTEADREVVTRAKHALAQLDALVPSAQEVLDDYFDVSGPLESWFDRAQNEAWREEAPMPELVLTMREAALQSIRVLFNDLARAPEVANAAYALVEAQTPLLEQALKEAQADGWMRGDYSSEVREKLVDEFKDLVLRAARSLV